MISVKMTDGKYTIDSAYQWDKNQVLEIYGVSLPSPPEIHFTNTATAKALVVQSTMDNDGVIKADIPNSLFKSPSKITAYIYGLEGETSKTFYKIDIPVIARPEPNYSTEDPEENPDVPATVRDCLKLKDTATGKTYKLEIINGKLTMEEVS